MQKYTENIIDTVLQKQMHELLIMPNTANNNITHISKHFTQYRSKGGTDADHRPYHSSKEAEVKIQHDLRWEHLLVHWVKTILEIHCFLLTVLTQRSYHSSGTARKCTGNLSSAEYNSDRRKNIETRNTEHYKNLKRDIMSQFSQKQNLNISYSSQFVEEIFHDIGVSIISHSYSGSFMTSK